MNLSNYSNRDINMYLSGTYVLYKNKPIRIARFDEEDYSHDNCSMRYDYLSNNRICTDIARLSKLNTFDVKAIPTGYYNLDGFVVYIYKQQRSHFKKFFCEGTARYFVPQDRELRILRIPYTINYKQMLLEGQKFYTLEDAFEKMQDKKVFSLALHSQYALVKKSTKKDFVIYYKTEPVITYDGEELKAIVDECHLTKFKLEMELCD